jgi:undecaprenyl-diphosphatase
LPLLHAIVLGITQGLSEFLPISSSGHLLIVPWLFGWKELTRDPALNQTFDVALHLGTFVAVVAYFWRDLLELLAAAFRSLRRRSVQGAEEHLAWMLVIASIPAATIGLALDSAFEGHSGGFIVVGLMLVVFGLVLWWADRMIGGRDIEGMGLRDALLMGFAQAAALQPGVSRSGATISMGRWLKFDRDAAARISFLMSIPITGGAGAYKLLKVFVVGDGLPHGFAGAFVVGILASAVTGFLAVWLLLRLVRTRSFTPFVIYRVIVGIGGIGLAIAR